MNRPKSKRQELHEITLAFHKRVFGEEMARVNFLPVEERKRYLARLRARAAKTTSRPDEAIFLTG